ncbi:MAG: 23S rRNA (adenine(2030)-N(6))-methyltransferase RlmJ [Gemmatimonadetes bacterium]|nr:23S rRNA (adenine(2030)-N(6))-methyltransferase RlmJ [Gemmatimonadota bacterium]
MRIIAGKMKGRDLLGPSDFRVHPTAEHVRAALLDLLAGDLADARVIDLFAGTGALGLEALSRGAKSCDFVETRPSSLHALKANIATCRAREKTRVFRKDAVQFAAALTTKNHYGLAFADPPYESRQLDRVITSWMENKFSPVLAVEHAAIHVIPPGVYHAVLGESAITIYRQPPGPVDSE